MLLGLGFLATPPMSYFELEARKAVYRWVRDGDVSTLEEGFTKASHDMELLNRHLVIPFSLRAVPPPPTVPTGWQRDPKKGGGRGQPPKRPTPASTGDAPPPPKKITKMMKTPDGKPICWKYNRKEGCSNSSCRFLHVCQRCLGKHPYHSCTQVRRSDTPGPAN